jgi:hypothetical protein
MLALKFSFLFEIGFDKDNVTTQVAMFIVQGWKKDCFSFF